MESLSTSSSVFRFDAHSSRRCVLRRLTSTRASPVPGGLLRIHSLIAPLFYDGQMAGACIADVVVEPKIVLELKAFRTL